MYRLRTPLLIVNLRAGKGRIQRPSEVSRLCDLLSHYEIHPTVMITACPGDATRFAEQSLRQGVREIIVAGGDGTINEVIQSVIGTNVCLAIWPCGTANLLATELQISTQLEEVVAAIVAEKRIRVYLGKATREGSKSRYFALMIGVGPDAAIVYMVNSYLKQKFGEASFWIAGLRFLATWKPKKFVVEIETKQHIATFAAICNSPWYGGNLLIAPNARIDRPGFEVYLINTTSKIRYLRLLSYAASNSLPPEHSDISFIQCTSASIFGEHLKAQADGELFGELPISIEVAEASIDFIRGG